ncbi:peptidylprolyl isomerase [Patescibacteria group bacterium]
MRKKIFQGVTIFFVVIFISGCGLFTPDDPMSGKSSRGKLLNVSEQEKDKGATKDSISKEELNNKNNVSEKNMIDVEKESLAYSNKYKTATLVTNYGSIEVEFFGEDSPVTVGNFLRLAEEGFYDGTLFHRVITEFMIQGGDPNSKSSDWSTHGMGGPGYTFKDEFNKHPLVRGSLAMANSGPGTNGSQFFIVTAESTPWLDGKHTNFGKIVSGMDVVEKIEGAKTNQSDHPLEDVAIEKIELK